MWVVDGVILGVGWECEGKGACLHAGTTSNNNNIYSSPQMRLHRDVIYCYYQFSVICCFIFCVCYNGLIGRETICVDQDLVVQCIDHRVVTSMDVSQTQMSDHFGQTAFDENVVIRHTLWKRKCMTNSLGSKTYNVLLS